MVSEIAVHRDDAPCFVFEDVPGTIKGSRVLVNFFGGKRKNMTLGFPTDLSKVELSEGFRLPLSGCRYKIPDRTPDAGSWKPLPILALFRGKRPESALAVAKM